VIFETFLANFRELRHGEVRRIALIRSLWVRYSRRPEVRFLANRSGELHLAGALENSCISKLRDQVVRPGGGSDQRHVQPDLLIGAEPGGKAEIP
jgi:hypothetical protein